MTACSVDDNTLEVKISTCILHSNFFSNYYVLSLKCFLLVSGVTISLILLAGLAIGLYRLIQYCIGDSVSQHILHLRIVLLMLLCDPPVDTPLSSVEPVQIIPLCFNAWVYAGMEQPFPNSLIP